MMINDFPSTMTLKAGDQLDHKYWLLHALGQGGFGEVWLAQATVLGDHHVAIKFLTAANPEKDKEFLVEMRALAGLNLPGIVVTRSWPKGGGKLPPPFELKQRVACSG